MGDTNSADNNSLTKKCPFCAEEIKKDAILCRHCGSSLTPVPQPTQAAALIVKSDVKKSGEGLFLQSMNCGCAIVLICVILVIIVVIIFSLSH